MRDHWFHLDSGSGDPAFNMALDEALLENAANIGAPVLRFYGWNEPAATFGYSQKYTETERITLLRPLIRRPTGGGLVPHDADWTYSLTFPPNHFWYSLKAVESYEKVHAWLSDAFKKLNVPTTLSPCCIKEIPGQCFIGAEKYDLLWHGRKIAGAAQRRTKNGLLIQGSIQPPPLPLVKADFRQAMQDVATEQFAAQWITFEPDTALQQCAATLTEQKYSQATFNQKR